MYLGLSVPGTWLVLIHLYGLCQLRFRPKHLEKLPYYYCLSRGVIWHQVSQEDLILLTWNLPPSHEHCEIQRSKSAYLSA